MAEGFDGGRIVIIGGGIIGCAIAYHLSRRGHPEVLILERGLVGEGATAHATGGIRTQFSTRINVELAQLSLPVWRAFDDHLCTPLDFRQHGYLFLIAEPAVYEAFQGHVALQRSLGVTVDVLDPAHVAERFPGIRTDDLIGATFTPHDGSASPNDAVQGFVKAAKRGGVVVREHTDVTGVELDSDGVVRAVVAGDELFAAECVIIAAGPQARAVGRQCGVDLPVFPHSRQAFAAAPIPAEYAALPLTIDMSSGAYVHPEGDGASAIVGGRDRDTASVTEPSLNWSAVPDLVAALVNRFPGLDDVKISNGWAGLREMTPDDHAIVGPIESVPGLWVVAGFSGHGFMQAPAVGDAVAAELLGQVPAVDLSPLRLERFAAKGVPPAEQAVF